MNGQNAIYLLQIECGNKDSKIQRLEREKEELVETVRAKDEANDILGKMASSRSQEIENLKAELITQKALSRGMDYA